jgi:hypothetical protein
VAKGLRRWIMSVSFHAEVKNVVSLLVYVRLPSLAKGHRARLARGVSVAVAATDQRIFNAPVQA